MLSAIVLGYFFGSSYAHSGTHELAGTTCKSINPNNITLLEWTEAGLINSSKQDFVSVICPLIRRSAVELTNNSENSISIVIEAFNGDSTYQNMSCALQENVGGGIALQTMDSRSIGLNSGETNLLTWPAISVSSKLLSSLTLECNLPPQARLLKISTDTTKLIAYPEYKVIKYKEGPKGFEVEDFKKLRERILLYD